MDDTLNIIIIAVTAVLLVMVYLSWGDKRRRQVFLKSILANDKGDLKS